MISDTKVVAIGGGTGLSTMLKGLKLHTHNITAVVTVADDGGSSGILRSDLGIEYMIRMDVTEAACVTHGGVIMSMLSQRALPSRRPEQWMADPGCGYTVQTDVQLWMRDKLVEAIDIVPFGYADTLRGQAETEENEAYE